MSKALAGLFPSGVAVAGLEEPGDPSTLLPAEAQHLGGAVPARAREFAAGRACARRSLAQFGVEGAPILVAPDRSPVWPAGFTGSITHTHGFAAAVVGERRCFHGLGIDSEANGEVREELWPMICAPRERAWLETLPGAGRAAAATLLFSAKEAYYKCCHPVTGVRPGFHDVCIVPEDWGAGAAQGSGTGSFRVIADAGTPQWGRYHLAGGLILTGIAWLAESCREPRRSGR